MNPQSFGKYQLIKKLATGGMAEVWLARQTGIEGFSKNVVVKRILPHLAEDAEFVDMFGNEARIAARFNHPNIAQVYEFGSANGTYFISMEFIHGEDLGRVMRKAYNAGGWIALPLAIRIVAACCEGLYYAHTRSDETTGKALRVVHRDISPQNILISFDGSVKLVDFGIAKAADQASLTKSGAIKGKFAYMAPEQAAGKPLDHRADIFAIGLVLYELITGQRPLKRESELGTLQAALECNIQAPSQVAEVPAELDSVVMRALAKAADDRYQNARQFQLALEEFLVGQRWVASSVQISELMEMLFADRLEEERHSGNPEPKSDESLLAQPAAPAPPPEEPPSPPRSGSRPPPPPRSASTTNTQAASEMSWEAPPGEMPQKQRTGMRAALKRTESATLPVAELSDDQEWEAPESTAVPKSRRTSNEAPRRSNSLESTSVARSPSRLEVGRGTGTEAPAQRRTGARTGVGPEAEVPAPRPSRVAAPAPRARPIEDEDEDPERTQLPPPPEPPRRRTGMAQAPASEVRRRTSSRPAEMPEAPPPPVRRRPSYEEEQEESLSISSAKAGQSSRAKNLLGAVVALAVVGLGVVFWQPLWGMLNTSASDGQDIYINLESNEPIQVSVRHTERCQSPVQVTQMSSELIRSLKRAEGAHLQDTLILENKQQGIYREIPIPYGEPNEVKTLPQQEFKKGFFKLKVRPYKSLVGAEIYREGQMIYSYQSEHKYELVEGTHHLELRGGPLKEPVPVAVEVKARGTEEIVVDVSKSL